MEGSKCLDDVLAQPCAIFPIPSVGLAASPYHTIEIFVDSYAVSVLSHQGTHGMTDVDFIRKDDETLHRTEPEYFRLVTETIPGKNAIAISQQQAVDTQIATNRKASILIAIMRIGKVNLVRSIIYL
ncbi:Uncharacterised protein [Segatella copri]|nr:Uncharacterised protein [Segatella copri]